LDWSEVNEVLLTNSCRGSLLLLKLNLYGFQRLTRGRDRGGYYHEHFLKDRVFLARSIQRIMVKGTRVRARSNPDQEPNFWSMPWVLQQAPQKKDVPYYNDIALLPLSCEPLPSLENVQSDTSTLRLPSTFFLHRLPLNLEPTALPSEISLHCTSHPLEDDDVLFGKHFYDVEMIGCSQSVPLSPQSICNTERDTSLQHPYDLPTMEVEKFLEDFDLTDIGSDIDDDQEIDVFLEQMI
jgi:hypothetical protein